VLEACGHTVIIANPRRLKLISESINKHDKADAMLLARLARADMDLLKPVRHRTREAQADLATIRARDGLVRTRGKLVNCVRGLVKPFGVRLPACATACFAIKSSPHVPDDLRSALAPILTQIDILSDAILGYDAQIEHMAITRYTDTTGRLKQVAGVGTLSAMTYILCIDDPNRFRRSRDVGCYLGLKPAQKQSWRQRARTGNHQERKRTAPAHAGSISALHSGSFRAGHRSSSLGTETRRPGQGFAQASTHRGGAQARSSAPSVVGNRRDL
jgi:transposase